MRKAIYSTLLFTCSLIALASCDNGAYVANPANPANNSINPLVPLTASQFTWGGNAPLSAVIDGSPFQADTATFALDTSGTNIIVAGKGKTEFVLYLNSVYGGTLYNMGYKQGLRIANYIPNDSFTSSTSNFVSYSSILGNSGEVLITENDSAYIEGKFYFQGVNGGNATDVVSVTNGYFKIKKF